jgi:hypothetical protein
LTKCRKFRGRIAQPLTKLEYPLLQSYLSQTREDIAALVNKENCIANDKTDDVASRNGNVAVRVDSGAATLNVHGPLQRGRTERVLTTFGPYTS